MSFPQNRRPYFGGKPFNPVPDGWKDYTNTGTRISGTRFVCMKVPLKEELCQKVDEKQRFSPTEAISILKEQGMKLGLLIDLTNTKRYYNPREFTGSGIAYEKIFVEGHEVPGSKQVEKFIDVVENFEKLQKKEDESVVIGIHCTHGINRTGYLVCRYLIDRLGWSAGKAIEEFGRARGHPIERENYLKALQSPSSSPSNSKDQSGREAQVVDNHRYREKRTEPQSSIRYSRDRSDRYRHDYSSRWSDGNRDRSEWGWRDEGERWRRQDHGPYRHFDSRHSFNYRYDEYSRPNSHRRWDDNGKFTEVFRHEGSNKKNHDSHGRDYHRYHRDH